MGQGQESEGASGNASYGRDLLTSPALFNVQPMDAYLRQAERAQQAADNARDPEARRLLKSAAERWWQLAKFAERKKVRASPENKVADGEEPGQCQSNH